MTAGSIGVLGFVAQDGFAGKLDLVAFLADALDHDLLAFFQLVAHVLDATVGDFRDVQQAVGAREDFDERAEINDAAKPFRDRFGRFRLPRSDRESESTAASAASPLGSRDRDRAVV